MNSAIFITGTDTDVGKTVITACLAYTLKRIGKKIAVYKPVQCGNLLKGDIASSDLAFVRKLSQINKNYLINDYSFSFSASPHLSAECDKDFVSVKKIKGHIKELLTTKNYDLILIEGAGGLIVPLTRAYTQLELIKDTKIPVIVVARAGLGTINHTSLTLRALRDSKCKVIGVILNFYKGGLIEDDNIKVIQSLNNVRVIGVVPFSKNLKKLAMGFGRYVRVNEI